VGGKTAPADPVFWMKTRLMPPGVVLAGGLLLGALYAPAGNMDLRAGLLVAGIAVMCVYTLLVMICAFNDFGRLLAWPSWFPELHARLSANRAVAFVSSAARAGASAPALIYLGKPGRLLSLVPLLLAVLISAGVMGFGLRPAKSDAPRPASREDLRRALVSIAVGVPHYAAVGLFAWIVS
jgi:hypothetical protein